MRNIKHIIWDLDGVLYEYHPAYIEACYEAYAVAATKLIAGMDKETARALAKESYEKTHMPSRVFVDRFGLEETIYIEAFSDALDISSLAPNPVMREKMLQANTTHNILTISDQAWAQRITKHLQLNELFPASSLITAEKCKRIHKAESTEPFQVALAAAQADPETTIMIEDTQKNLRHAKALGLTTVWVHPKQGDEKQLYTDYMFVTPMDFLDYFIAEKH